MTDDETLQLLVRHGSAGADLAVLEADPPTEAEVVRIAINVALQVLLDNGLIAVVPREDWPAYVELDRWRHS